MLELPGVSEAAAIGVDDPAKGQVLVVFAIPSGEGMGDPDLPVKVAQHIEVRLGRAFRPNNVHVVAQLPKTRSSKVMRRLIRDFMDQHAPVPSAARKQPARKPNSGKR